LGISVFIISIVQMVNFVVKKIFLGSGITEGIRKIFDASSQRTGTIKKTCMFGKTCVAD